MPFGKCKLKVIPFSFGGKKFGKKWWISEGMGIYTSLGCLFLPFAFHWFNPLASSTFPDFAENKGRITKFADLLFFVKSNLYSSNSFFKVS